MEITKIIKNIPIIRRIALWIMNYSKRSYMFLCNKIYGINSNKVIFVSFGGKTYSDNPRAISEMLHETNPYLNIIWLFVEPSSKKGSIPDYITCLKANSFKALKALATSKFWIDNFNKPLYMYKSREQVYIQTWHGDRAFKRILFDSTFISKDYKLLETDVCDFIVTGSKFAEKMYKSAYRYNGEFLKVGLPRNDVLINMKQETINKIKIRLGLDFNYKIMLYAPTLRRKAAKEKENQEIADIDLLEVINKLNSDTGHKWVCLTRAHSAVSGLKGIPSNNNIKDVTGYEDMADLLQVTNLLITDYSSSATDFILTNKPTILYQSDYEEYIKHDRTFYYDLKETGFLIAYNRKELFNNIDKILEEDPRTRNEIIQDFYGVYETGKASIEVAKFINEKINWRNVQ